MKTKLIAKVTSNKTLEIPVEIQENLEPFSEYEIFVTEDQIILKKTSPKISFEDIRRKVKEAGKDPNQPTLEEISQIVKEVRRELWGKK